jgi:hypothetical protein
MGKIENTEQRKYARVMHHIGGLSGKNDNTDMIRGGEDELNLLDETKLQDMQKNGVDIGRLITVGALREATPDEVSRFEIANGIRSAAPTSELFTQFTSGDEGLKAVTGVDASSTGVVGANVNSSREPFTAPGSEAGGDAAREGAAGASGENQGGFLGSFGGQQQTGQQVSTNTGGQQAGDSTNSDADTGGTVSGGSTTYKGMTKGELSEYTVPELKEMAKEEKGEDGELLIADYSTMTKEPLLNALMALGR